MYITLKSIKRNLGFKGIEISDIIIALPIVVLFLSFFLFTNLKLLAVVLLMTGIFILLPTNVSNKNRMYKVILLLLEFIKKEKIFVYQREEENSEN